MPRAIIARAPTRKAARIIKIEASPSTMPAKPMANGDSIGARSHHGEIGAPQASAMPIAMVAITMTARPESLRRVLRRFLVCLLAELILISIFFPYVYYYL